jgi:hypothetical protein
MAKHDMDTTLDEDDTVVDLVAAPEYHEADIDLLVELWFDEILCP